MKGRKRRRKKEEGIGKYTLRRKKDKRKRALLVGVDILPGCLVRFMRTASRPSYHSNSLKYL
jgi:hypothetical protein